MISRSGTILVLAACVVLVPSLSSAEVLKRTAKSGVAVGLSAAGKIDRMTCKTDANAVIAPNVTKQPQHGRLDQRRVTLKFQSLGGNHICNGQPYEATAVFYTSAKGYRGPDVVEISTTRLLGAGIMEVEEKLIYEIDVQ